MIEAVGEDPQKSIHRSLTLDEMAARIGTTREVVSRFLHTGFFQKIAWASRHQVLGWPVLLLVLWTIFYGVGTVASKIAADWTN